MKEGFEYQSPEFKNESEIVQIAEGINILYEKDEDGKELVYMVDPETKQKLNSNYGFNSIRMEGPVLVGVGDHVLYILDKKTGKPFNNTYTYLEWKDGKLKGVTNDQIRAVNDKTGKLKISHEEVEVDPETGLFKTKPRFSE